MQADCPLFGMHREIDGTRLWRITYSQAIPGMSGGCTFADPVNLLHLLKNLLYFSHVPCCHPGRL